MKVDYAEISKTYDNYRSFSYSEMQKMIGFGNLKNGMKILDLGCGTGNLSARLLECLEADIIGVDRSVQMLEKAKAKTNTLRVLCADADHSPLPFNDHSFDVIIGSYVIHHIKNRMAMIAECFRILRNGALILLTSGHDQIDQLHPVIKGFFPSLAEMDKKRFPDIPILDHFLESAGFKDIRHEELIIDKIPIDMAYLEKVKNKFVSTFYLLSENEFNKGVKRLEAFISNGKEHALREWRGTMIYGRK